MRKKIGNAAVKIMEYTSRISTDMCHSRRDVYLETVAKYILQVVYFFSLKSYPHRNELVTELCREKSQKVINK